MTKNKLFSVGLFALGFAVSLNTASAQSFGVAQEAGWNGSVTVGAQFTDNRDQVDDKTPMKDDIYLEKENDTLRLLHARLFSS